MNTTTITVDDLTFRYPGSDEPVLQDANLRVEPDSFTAIIGANGSDQAGGSHDEERVCAKSRSEEG